MPTPSVHKANAWEDGGIVLMARVVDGDGDRIQQADISSITYTVYDKSNPVTDIAANSPLTIGDVVFDVLQTPTVWTTDDTGYNFRYDAVAAELPDGNKTYRFEFAFTPTTGQKFYVVFEVATMDLLTS